MKQYYAFISYKRDDQKWAEWLQEKLEHYKLPSNLNGRDSLPKEIRPIFRDKSELAAGVLADEIQKALDNSKYLIVICSPHSAKSEWVNKEVQAFIDSGRTDKIIPFIIEGVPNSGNDETECFPKAIRELPAEDELLGVNINEMGRDAAAVKVVAQMFGLRFDDLWQRHEREKKRRRHLITAAITAFAIAVICVAGWIWHQNVVLKEKDWKMMESQSKLVAEMIKLNAKDDSYLASNIALEILPKNVNNPTDRPYTVEAERALRETSMHNTAVLKGHLNNVVSAVFSPDGKYILSASSDSTMKLWDFESGTLIKTIKRNTWRSSNAVFSADGKKIYCSNDSTINIYNVESGIVEKTIIENWWIKSIDLISDEKYIMATSWDNIIRIVDIKTGETIRTIEKDCDFWGDVTINKDNTMIVASPSINRNYTCRMNGGSFDLFADSVPTNDYAIKIWNYDTEKEIQTLVGHKYFVSSLDLTPDGKRLVSTSYDLTIKIWDVETGKEIHTLRSNNSAFLYATYSPDGKYIVSISVSPDQPISVWDAETGIELKRFSSHTSSVNSVAFSPDSKYFVTSSDDETIMINELESSNEKAVILKNNAPITMGSMIMSPDGKKVVSNLDYNTLVVSDMDTGTELFTLSHDKYVICFAFSPDSKQIVTSSNNTLVFWDAENGNKIKMLDKNINNVSSIIYYPDGQHFITTSYNDSIREWDEDTGEDIRSIYCYGLPINNSAISPDGKSIVVSSYRYLSAMIFDIETGKIKNELSGHKERIHSVSYSPDGKLIVTASYDRSVKIWDSETGNELFTMNCRNDGFMHAGFSRDGKYVVGACADNTVFIWDIKTHGILQIFEGHTYGVEYASFTPDGRHIISAAQDSTIRIWDFPPLQELIDQTRERFKNRPLTEEERKMYYLE